jgi:hypothetical protein
MGHRYTAEHVAEMVGWLARVPCCPGGVHWAWDIDSVFHAPGDQVAAAASGDMAPLTRTLTDWLRERGEYDDAPSWDANGAPV